MKSIELLAIAQETNSTEFEFGALQQPQNGETALNAPKISPIGYSILVITCIEYPKLCVTFKVQGAQTGKKSYEGARAFLVDLTYMQQNPISVLVFTLL